MPTLTGTTLDNTGSPLAGATVKVFRASDDVLVATGTSNGSGVYSVMTPDAGPYWVNAYTSLLSGVSLRTLMAVLDGAAAYPSWVPPGASWAIDFANDRAWLDGAQVPISDLLAFTDSGGNTVSPTLTTGASGGLVLTSGGVRVDAKAALIAKLGTNTSFSFDFTATSTTHLFFVLRNASGTPVDFSSYSYSGNDYVWNNSTETSLGAVAASGTRRRWGWARSTTNRLTSKNGAATTTGTAPNMTPTQAFFFADRPYANQLVGTIHAMAGWSQYRTSEGVRTIAQAAPTTKKRVFKGDSLFAGTYPAAQTSVPTAYAALRPSETVVNLGVNSETLASMDTNFTTQLSGQWVNTADNWIVLLGYTNELLNGTGSLADYQAKVQSYSVKARAAGFSLADGSIIPASGVFTTGQEAVRVAINDWLKWNWPTIADAFCDFAAIPELNPPTSTYYQDDPEAGTQYVHPKSNGYALMAAVAHAALPT